MKKGEFFKLLKNPDVLTENTLGQLQEIINEYPFFQAGRMLLLKNMYNINHIRYNSELKQTAVYVPDRSRLFCLIYDIGLTKEEEALQEIVHEEESAVIQNEQNTVVEELAVVEVVPVEKELSVEENTNAIVTQEEEKQVENDNTDRQEIKELASTNELISDNYLNASDEFLGDDGEVYSFSKSFKNKFKKQEEEVDDIVFPSADLLDYENATTGYNISDLANEKELEADKNHSFSDWLQIMRYSTSEIKKEEPKKTKSMDLINNFLSAQPKIVPKITKNLKNVDLSEHADSQDEDILSETLADIYIKQGHKMKAISILEKLRLKYPEKNVYFARRISDVKKN